MTESKYFESLSSAFMAHFARRTADIIIDQSSYLVRLGLSTPSTLVSTMLLLKTSPEMSVTDIADAVGVTHQMVVQRIAKLEKFYLVK